MMNNRYLRLVLLIAAVYLLFLMGGSIASLLDDDKSNDRMPIDPYSVPADSSADLHSTLNMDSVNPSPSAFMPICDSAADHSSNRTPKPGYESTRKPAPSRNSVISAYDDGYQEGYDQGCEDALLDEDFGANFDDDNDYSGRENAQYCEGYEDGYENGYYDHISH